MGQSILYDTRHHLLLESGSTGDVRRAGLGFLRVCHHDPTESQYMLISYGLLCHDDVSSLVLSFVTVSFSVEGVIEEVILHGTPRKGHPRRGGCA